jgi:recombination protein RecA
MQMTTDKSKSDPFISFFQAYADTEEAMQDVRRGHETLGYKVPVVSTGSLVLDDALSSGGYPCGRLIQLYGVAGSGKSMLAMIGIANAQKASPTARQLFIDAEQSFSPTWAEQLGIDTKRLIIVDGDMAVNGRKCFEMLLGVPKEDAKTHVLKGQAKEGLLDKIISGELDINFIVLDSLGSLIVPGEDISQVGKMNMALLARFLTTTLRKLSLAVSKANIPFVLINHVKSSMDMYSDHTFSGGNSYNHFLSANIFFRPVNRADAKILDENEDRIGATISATVEKSKFGPWPRKCEFKVNFGSGIINQEEEIATLAIDYGIIDHPTAPSYIYGDRKWVGKEKFSAALIEDQALAQELIQKIGEARDKKHETKLAEQEQLSEELVEQETKVKEKATKTKNKKGSQ